MMRYPVSTHGTNTCASPNLPSIAGPGRRFNGEAVQPVSGKCGRSHPLSFETTIFFTVQPVQQPVSDLDRDNHQ